MMPQRFTRTSSSRYAGSARAGNALSTAHSSPNRASRPALRSLTNTSMNAQYASTEAKSRLPRNRSRWSTTFFNPPCEDSTSPFSCARPGVFFEPRIP